MEQRAWLGRRYQVAGFNCSEMSAFLEASLEGDGWHTYIAVGPCPFDPDSNHAWLLVETSPDSYVPIEATAPAIIYRSDCHALMNISNMTVSSRQYLRLWNTARQISTTAFIGSLDSPRSGGYSDHSVR